MPPTADSHYFPALDKCLAGDARLISWRTALRALSNEEVAIDNAHLEHFFTDNETITALSNALDVFQKPSSSSAKDFDTKTAPILVSQTSNSAYDLEELKKDARWLSEAVQIEELAALRMTIIEWQERASDELLLTAVGGHNNVSPVKDRASSSGAAAQGDGAPSRPALDCKDEEVRRGRLLAVYLSERNHLLTVITDLFGQTVVNNNQFNNKDAGALRRHASKTWIDDVASRVRQNVCAGTVLSENAPFSLNCIQKLGSLLRGIEDTASWPKPFARDQSKELSYLTSQFYELLDTLRLLLSNIYALDGVSNAATVHGWFLLMEEFGFLQDPRPYFPPMDAAQLLISVISVEILKPQLVTGEVMKMAGKEKTAVGDHRYFRDDKCIGSVNNVLYRSAKISNQIAAPAIYAWSIITFLVRDFAMIHSDGRLEAASDSPREARRSSIGPRSEMEKLYWETLSIPEWESLASGTPGGFAAAAVDSMNVFEVIAILSDVADTTYPSVMNADTAFICKEALLDLVREGMPLVKYNEAVLHSILSILTPSELSPSSWKHVNVLASKVLHDTEQLRPMIIDQAIWRYPYELSPLLRLFTALARAESPRCSSTDSSDIVQLLENLESFTQSVPAAFRDFNLVNEELNENDMFLTEALPLFSGRREMSRSRQLLLTNGTELAQNGEDTSFVVASGSRGRIVKESQPRVLKLEYAHSGLQYLGLLLATLLPGTGLTPSSPEAELDRNTAAEIMALCSALITSALTRQSGSDHATQIIVSLSKALRDEQDIISVVCEIFEAELLAHADQRATDGSRELVTASAEFLNAIVKLSPERVWSHLARSSLLGLSDAAPTLLLVVNGFEAQSGHFRFLNACVDLHSSLLDDAISGLVKRKAQPPKTSNRFAAMADSLDSTPERCMSLVLITYQKVILDVLQCLPELRFELQQERCRVVTNVLSAFTMLLKSTYGIHLVKESSTRLTHILAPAAAILLDACAPKSGTSPLSTNFSRLLAEALVVADSSLPSSLRGLLLKQTKTACQFLTLLLRAAKLGIDILSAERNSLSLEVGVDGFIRGGDSSPENRKPVSERALRVASHFIGDMRLYGSLLACDHALKEDLYAWLSELIEVVGSSDGDPPSILAQFDTGTQKAFLAVVTQLDRPLCDVDIERQALDFLSTVLSSRQHWFAVFLLTGELPKQRAHRGQSESIKGKPIFDYALDQLSQISLLAPERAVGMLKFVATAQKTWIWATATLRSHPDFVKNTLEWLDTLGPVSRDPSSGASIICAKECFMASLLCDIFAINLHAGLNTGDRALLRSLTAKLNYLRDHGVAVNAYNRSLHKNLAENLKRKFPYSELADFRRTAINHEPYGTEYFYDREIAAKVLSHDVAWHGPERSRSQGFSDEFGRANANLSLLNAQKRLLGSWKTLVTTPCEYVDQDTSLQAELAKVAERCLQANVGTQLDEPGVADTMSTRVEMSFVIVSKLVASKAENGAMKVLLPAAWELVRTSPVDYDVATVREDVQYYRNLLQVLYLTIQPHIYMSRPSSDQQPEYLAPAVGSILVNIVGKVVLPGFRALCGNLHNNMELALPADFALLTALLQSMLSVPGISSVYTLLSDLVAGSSIVRGALSLYSWADQLSEVTSKDPVYGEVAVMFLLALSSVRPIAEQMALDGVLTNLSTANLSNYFRKPGGKGPFDDPPRMFVVWTEGFLPLCLNLLDSVGPPVAAEVVNFLNSFPEQLRRAEKSLQNEAPSVRNPRAGSVTLGMLSEAHCLTIIAMILNLDTARGAAEGINAADIPSLEYDHEAVQGTVEGLTRSKRSLNDRITPGTPLEERWQKLQVNISGESLLKQKIIKELDTMAQYLGSQES